ncbi:hypothetical protein N9N40_09640 [Planktomarina temperata]|nr:hypothetical protein [Planktomarina temperata]
MFTKKILLTTLLAFTTLAACSQSETTNKQASAVYGVQSNIGKINYKITDEVVQGTACSGRFLMIPTGANEFVGAGIDTNSSVGKAKAAAVYNALYGDEAGKLGMDIIAQPQFRVENNSIPMLSRQVCATVIGYRAVVKNIEN